MIVTPTRKRVCTLALAMAMWLSSFFLSNPQASADSQGASPPSAPVVTGVEHQATYEGPVVPNWVDEAGTSSTATLRKDGGQAARYLKGTPIERDGSYVLTVTAKKASNGRSAETMVFFTIASGPPDPVTVAGVSEGGVYASAVATWADAPGTESIATLAKDGAEATAYASGTEIEAAGSYVLTVVTRKLSNDLTVRQEIAFSVDSPPSPANISIWGDMRAPGVYYQAYLIWWDVEGTRSTGVLRKEGGTSRFFQSGGYISENGEYELTVTTTKLSSGLTAESVFRFAIYKGYSKPTLSGTKSAGIYLEPVTLSWTPLEGTSVINTRLVNRTTGQTHRDWPNHSTIVADGSYEFWYTVAKPINGTVVYEDYFTFFLITGIRGVADGHTYRSVTPTWASFVNVAWAENTATLSRNGGPAVPYERGTTIDEPGHYVLSVTWKSTSDIHETQSVSFTITGEG